MPESLAIPSPFWPYLKGKQVLSICMISKILWSIFLIQSTLSEYVLKILGLLVFKPINNLCKKEMREEYKFTYIKSSQFNRKGPYRTCPDLT